MRRGVRSGGGAGLDVIKALCGSGGGTIYLAMFNNLGKSITHVDWNWWRKKKKKMRARQQLLYLYTQTDRHIAAYRRAPTAVRPTRARTLALIIKNVSFHTHTHTHHVLQPLKYKLYNLINLIILFSGQNNRRVPAFFCSVLFTS